MLELDSALRRSGLPNGVSLTLHRGEILGIAGIVGSGRTEMLRAIYGLDPVRSGTVKVGRVSVRSATPAERIDQGVGMLSEDRKNEGLALEHIDRRQPHAQPARRSWLVRVPARGSDSVKRWPECWRGWA